MAGDAGLYDALEGELLTALSTPAISGLTTLAPTLSVVDLAEDAVRKPAVGIVDAGASFIDAISIGRRAQRAKFTFEVAVVVSSSRGKVQARATLRSLLEAARDRVHFLASAQPGPGRWLWKSDTPVAVTGDDLLAAVASFEIETLIGR